MRSYIACRILMGSGFGEVYNLAGGWRFYEAVTRGRRDTEHHPCGESK